MLTGAIAEARELGTEHYGTEHVLLAMLRDTTSAPARALARHGVAYHHVRSDMEQVLHARPGA